MRVQGVSDVLVIGAGPAGAAAATLLATRGVDVQLVDAARFPRDKTCGDAVSNNGMKLLAELGAADEVRSGPHALVRRGAALFPDGACVERSYADPGLIVPRLRLDDCIRKAAERAGAKLRQGTRIERLLLNDGRVCGAEAAGVRLQARVVIAADGYSSVALPALGVGTPHGRHLGLSSTLYARGTRHPLGQDVAEHFFERDLLCGYAWLFPAVDGVANLGVYLRQDAYRRGGLSLRALLDRFIARHPERFADMQPVGKPRNWSLPLAPTPFPITADGLLVVGDAGAFIDPFTGEGIWQALFTGMAAARAALEAVRAPGGLDHALRARFERECEATIGRPSRAKMRVQDAMRWVIGSGAYRLPPVRAALRFAYGQRTFEMTKA